MGAFLLRQNSNQVFGPIVPTRHFLERLFREKQREIKMALTVLYEKNFSEMALEMALEMVLALPTQLFGISFLAKNRTAIFQKGLRSFPCLLFQAN